MNILAIDTASKICGVSIEKDNKIKTYDKDGSLHHSVILPYMIEEAVQDNDMKVKDINYIVVSNGPGSYTGLRIGVSMAIGLATTDNIPIIYVDTIEQMAHNIEISKKKDAFILPMIDAKASRVYTAIFSKDYERYSKDSILNINDIINLIKKYIIKKNIDLYIVGDAIDIYKDELKVLKQYKNIKFASKKLNDNNSRSLIEAGHEYIKNGEISDKVNINYMQASQAERNLKKEI